MSVVIGLHMAVGESTEDLWWCNYLHVQRIHDIKDCFPKLGKIILPMVIIRRKAVIEVDVLDAERECGNEALEVVLMDEVQHGNVLISYDGLRDTRM